MSKAEDLSALGALIRRHERDVEMRPNYHRAALCAAAAAAAASGTLGVAASDSNPHQLSLV